MLQSDWSEQYSNQLRSTVFNIEAQFSTLKPSPQAGLLFPWIQMKPCWTKRMTGRGSYVWTGYLRHSSCALRELHYHMYAVVYVLY